MTHHQIVIRPTDRRIGLGIQPEELPREDEAISRLAKYVRTLYCICVREQTGNASYGKEPMLTWDGDPEGLSGRRRVPVWPKIAAAILAESANPEQYIRAQFVYNRLDRHPAPNTLYNDDAKERWRTFREEAKHQLKRQLASDMNQIQVHMLPFTVYLGWPSERALEYAVRNPLCGSSPVVRYCMAAQAGLAVADEYFERALVQYVFQMSDYDQLLTVPIPDRLKAEAIRLREQYLVRASRG